MGKTIANVLVGVAKLSIRQPNDAIAEWSTIEKRIGSYSAKLYKGGSGDEGSTHVQITPPTGITLGGLAVAVAAGHYSFWHWCSAITGNFGQFELKFEDPNSDAWVEITAVPLQGHLGGAVWIEQILQSTDKVGYGGHTEIGTSFFEWGLTKDLSDVGAAIDLLSDEGDASDWILTRVRIELWEPEPERTMYVDGMTINNVPYTIEPGGTAPALELSSPFTEVGYTEDGVTLEYTADEADIEVEEETFPIDRVITKETLAVTCNMAESSLYNIDKAMAGAALSGSILTLGGGVNKTMNLKIEGTNPAGYHRAIQIPLATATGAVGMSYKKGVKTIVPVTFQALKGDSPACTIVDNAA